MYIYCIMYIVYICSFVVVVYFFLFPLKIQKNNFMVFSQSQDHPVRTSPSLLILVLYHLKSPRCFGHLLRVIYEDEFSTWSCGQKLRHILAILIRCSRTPTLQRLDIIYDHKSFCVVNESSQSRKVKSKIEAVRRVLNCVLTKKNLLCISIGTYCVGKYGVITFENNYIINIIRVYIMYVCRLLQIEYNVTSELVTSVYIQLYIHFNTEILYKALAQCFL